MSKKPKKNVVTITEVLRKQILEMIDSHPPEGYGDFLQEIAADIEARLECLNDEAAEEADRG